MPHHDEHVQPDNESSRSAMPIHSLADLVLDGTNFSSALASAHNTTPPAPQEDTLPPSVGKDTHNPVSGSGFAEGHPSTSLADLILNNVTYDAILASSARGLALGPGSREPLSEDVRAPPNSPVQANGGYGSLLGVSAAIIEGKGK